MKYHNGDFAGHQIARNINAIVKTTYQTIIICEIRFGVLHVRGTDVTRSYIPYGSKRPHLQVGASK